MKYALVKQPDGKFALWDPEHERFFEKDQTKEDMLEVMAGISKFEHAASSSELREARPLGSGRPSSVA
ncbi:MAG TPA: hypothetical protein VHE30_27190 [Polyangiaceae bacterium]|nr:hypothetical protein [Polyangiaceae bacterium]